MKRKSCGKKKRNEAPSHRHQKESSKAWTGSVFHVVGGGAAVAKDKCSLEIGETSKASTKKSKISFGPQSTSNADCQKSESSTAEAKG